MECDWTDADIILFNSVCYPDSLIEGFLDRAVNLKAGTRIISLKPLPPRPHIQAYIVLKVVKMTWGIHEVTFYRKI